MPQGEWVRCIKIEAKIMFRHHYYLAIIVSAYLVHTWFGSVSQIKRLVSHFPYYYPIMVLSLHLDNPT